MAKSEEPRGRMRISGAGGGFSRFIVTVLVLLVIVYVTAFFALRTEGARSYVEERLERWMGLSLDVGAVRLGLPCVLVVERPVSEGFADAQGAGFRAQELRLGWRCASRWHVSLRRPELHLVGGQEEGWEPASFSRVGDLPFGSIADVSRMAEGLRRRFIVEVADGTVKWLSADGAELASARGVSFRLAPVRAPNRTMYYHELAAYSVAGIDGGRLQDVEREWLAVGDAPYIELHRDGSSSPVAERGFWEPRSAVRLLPAVRDEVVRPEEGVDSREPQAHGRRPGDRRRPAGPQRAGEQDAATPAAEGTR